MSMNLSSLSFHVIKISVVLCFLAATGCASRGDDDLQEFMQKAKSAPKGAIEPLPPLRSYDAFVYNAAAKRSPFDPPMQVKPPAEKGGVAVKPILDRKREYLESFNIDTLSMVGTLQKSGTFWALIKDGDGVINRVAVGNYLGKNHGKVVSASPTQIDLVEIVPDGLGGWLERPRTMKLSEQE